jgi:alcohol dehydrogenase class IV
MRVWPTPDCLIGSGVIRQVPSALRELGARRVMVVTDPGVVKAGILGSLKAALDADGIAVALYDAVQPDPSLTLVHSAADETRRAGVDAVIGLGGGSSLDTAKMAAALAANQRPVADYLAGTPLSEAVLPIIAVPTTAGTGSETTPIAVLSDEEAKVKKGFTSARIMPRYAFLDPDLTLGLSPAGTAMTGMDALCHAIESYISVNANPHTEALSLRAIELLNANIEEAYRNGKDLRAREMMLLGSFLAGMAFANAGVTAVHAFAYPLGGMFHVPHGLANALMLPGILAFDRPACEEKLSRIGRAMATGGSADTVVSRIEELSRVLQLPRNLAAIGVPAESVEVMSQAVVQIERLLKNNPRKVNLDDARSIYRQAHGR